ncbi:Dedicator of cytokinesis protein 11 [Thelohanellus kitauei]|uniref:Dedicator of cytokinesis protein 11 n=1 Tax=Thelohanellus kitauei TaxID=669202 RepID=A0A0C2JK60_THEKT|nr:Dedicator of cytokinesis protein 11 [Thelohanellus kitauei]
MTVMDLVDRIYATFKNQLEVENGSNPFMKEFFNLHLDLLQTNASFNVKKSAFALLRQLISKSPQIIFKGSNNYCCQICTQVIRISRAQNEWLKNEVCFRFTKSKNFIYLLLRSDYYFTGLPYLKSYISVIMACSIAVEEGSSTTFLMNLMQGLWDLVKQDNTLGNDEFAAQISDLTKRVKNIIRLTHRFATLENDPESLIDANYSIANSFSGVPELRQMWMEKVADLHSKYENFSEAAMCHLFVAWTISVTLRRKGIINESSLTFTGITPNVPYNDINFKEEALSDESKHSKVKSQLISG